MGVRRGHSLRRHIGEWMMDPTDGLGGLIMLLLLLWGGAWLVSKGWQAGKSR
jgi:hypothetical protein